MLKRLLCAVLLCVSFNSFSQSFPVEDGSGRIVYTGVEEGDGTADELYNKSKKWIVDTFHSIDHVLEVDSRTSSQIIGKGKVLIEGEEDFIGTTPPLILHFTFALNFKDGRYKYEFSDLRFQQIDMDVPFHAEDILLTDFTAPKAKAVGRPSRSHIVTKQYLKNVEKYKKDTSDLMLTLESSLKKNLAEETW
ncbi:DUF4468 domain-containing protein [uncultured Pontibacter sp.]|uniref:DUF4468 domain-containing protein n=1 Tax=uncultured Pontibacter sp. TaxID=453356 RepID=UPI00262D9CCF|nr:DUF4468 domain-containing protein [uncultured Pontibacter sp.]